MTDQHYLYGMKKKLLIDLSSLKNIYSGLGQIALGYGYYFRDHYDNSSPFELTLLLPQNFIGAFGDKVHYLSSSNLLRKHIPLLFPHYDLWHSIHQLSRYHPVGSSTKWILTIHDLNFLYEKKGRSREKRIRKIKWKICRADVVVCISQFTKDEVEQKITHHGKKCRVIYNKVDQLDKTLARQPQFVSEKPFFFSLGVIRAKKNFHVLLDLMKLMPEKHLYIVGNEADDRRNKYAAEIRRRLRKEQIGNVTLHGPVAHQEKIWLYSHCEAFFFPSLLEGFGLPVIEALQFGKPVFSSPETSLREIGGDHVFFWESFDPFAMYEVVERGLTRFRKNAKLSAAAIEYASTFKDNSSFKQYEELYASL
jgi:glycosyltransferase involved in cell wall biosynthesis